MQFVYLLTQAYSFFFVHGRDTLILNLLLVYHDCGQSFTSREGALFSYKTGCTVFI